MNKSIFLTGLLIFIFSLAAAAVPQYLTYQGVLRDGTGNPVTGTKAMSFTIYDAATNGNIIYDQGESPISVSNGSYTVQLGSISNATTVFDGSAQYLEVKVDGVALSPRLKINSVSYAIRADYATSAGTISGTINADTLDGFHAGVSGNSIVPTTDASTGKLNITTMPTGEMKAAMAITAESIVDNSISASKIIDYAITGSKLAGNINITTTGMVSAETLKTNKFQTSTAGDGFCVGSSYIPSGSNSTPVNNSLVTSNSLIFITPTTRIAGTYEALVSYDPDPTPPAHFHVGFCRTSPAQAPQDIYFKYLIIN